MKIAYIVAEKLDKDTGVAKKIRSQIEYWINEGHDVKLFYFSNATLHENFNDFNHKQLLHKSRIDFVLGNSGVREINEFGPDIIYFRYYLFSRAFRSVFKRYPSVFEINSNDLEESRISYPLSARVFLTLTRHLLLKEANGFITVTNELKKLVEKYDKKTVCIPNSIKGPFVPKTKSNNENGRNIFFMGSPNQEWHGVDKIVELAKVTPEFNYHLVGINDLLDIPPNVIQYGYLPQDKYLEIMKKCDIAMGTLALHRKSMNEACPLKVREYLKYGMPVIIGYEDSDFISSDSEFILKLTNNEQNVLDNMAIIIEMIRKSVEMLIDEKEISHIFIEKKEKRKLEFFQDIISS